MDLNEIMMWAELKNMFAAEELDDRPIPNNDFKVFQAYMFGTNYQAVFLYREDKDGSCHFLKGRLTCLTRRSKKHSNLTIEHLEEMVQ